MLFRISGMRKIEVITLFNANNLPSAKYLESKGKLKK